MSPVALADQLTVAILALAVLGSSRSLWRRRDHDTGSASPTVRLLFRVHQASLQLFAAIVATLVWHVWLGGMLPMVSMALDVLVVAFVVRLGHLVITNREQLRQAHAAIENGCELASRLSTQAETWLGHSSLESFDLTAREREVVQVICDGQHSDAAIAAVLVISPHTAGTHVRNILRKTGLKSRRDLMLLGLAGQSAAPLDPVAA